jgi:hypothetical protein
MILEHLLQNVEGILENVCSAPGEVQPTFSVQEMNTVLSSIMLQIEQDLLHTPEYF